MPASGTSCEDARALSGLAEEAARGQVLRGGRSWPSERKVGVGADRSGKVGDDRSCAATTLDTPCNNDADEQHAAHKVHFPDPPAG